MQVETVTCNDCGTAYERDPRYTHQPERCGDCEDERMIDRLRKDLDPESSGGFSRASALMRLKNEYQQMPIVDHDGSLITDLVVEHHLEGGGVYIEKISKTTECPECGYGKAYYSYTSNAGHHTIVTWECPDCGYSENTA